MFNNGEARDWSAPKARLKTLSSVVDACEALDEVFRYQESVSTHPLADIVPVATGASGRDVYFIHTRDKLKMLVLSTGQGSDRKFCVIGGGIKNGHLMQLEPRLFDGFDSYLKASAQIQAKAGSERDFTCFAEVLLPAIDTSDAEIVWLTETEKIIMFAPPKELEAPLASGLGR